VKSVGRLPHAQFDGTVGLSASHLNQGTWSFSIQVYFLKLLAQPTQLIELTLKKLTICYKL